MPPVPRPAVGAVIVRDQAILLVRRAREPAMGSWSLPGGKIEPGETARRAVEREVAEETGLTVQAGDLVGWVERIDAEHHFVILDFAAEVIGGTLRAGDDAADARWVPFDRVEELDLSRGLVGFLRDHGVL